MVKTTASGKNIPAKFQPCSIGMVDRIVQQASHWKDEPHRNVYFPPVVYKDGIKGRGKACDIVAVFGMVCDFDDDDAPNWKERLKLPPTLVFESSEGRFQCIYLALLNFKWVGKIY